jgi:hypothetical protein
MPSSDAYSEFWGETNTQQDKPNGAGSWSEPDMTVLRLQRRPPPPFPLKVLGKPWADWVTEGAGAASCPVDYVVAPLLATASALIGHARWAQAVLGWKEPPHLWAIDVGDSGDGKSPGSDSLLSDVVPELERRMVGDFPDRHEEWRQMVALDGTLRR